MIRTTLLSASLVALSACTTLGPKTDPVSHGITLPAAYDHAGTTAEERQDEQAWWADFGSEALDGLVAEALSTNQTLAGGIANVDAARAALKVSNASLLPQASGSVSASSDTEAGLGDVSSSARLSASYQLDLFGANAAAGFNRNATTPETTGDVIAWLATRPEARELAGTLISAPDFLGSRGVA